MTGGDFERAEAHDRQVAARALTEAVEAARQIFLTEPIPAWWLKQRAKRIARGVQEQ